MCRLDLTGFLRPQGLACWQHDCCSLDPYQKAHFENVEEFNWHDFLIPGIKPRIQIIVNMKQKPAPRQAITYYAKLTAEDEPCYSSLSLP